MIDILFKLDSKHCIVVTAEGNIFYYDRSIQDVMNDYLKPLLLSFNALHTSSKGLLGENHYKKPISYYTDKGLNMLIPMGSYRNQKCIWVSLNYCLHHLREEFNALLQIEVTSFQWSKLLSRAITYKNMFSLETAIPTLGNQITLDEMKSIIKDYSYE